MIRYRRLVDHEQRLSFAVIIGSFRGRGAKELDQHYVSLSYLHEPKGGILPAEAEEDLDEGPAGPRGDGAAEEAGGRGAGGLGSPQARSSEIAKRFSRWIREQRLAVLRGFGADEEEEGGQEEGKVVQDEASTRSDSSFSGGVAGDDGCDDDGEAEDGAHNPDNTVEEARDPIADAGAGEESGAVDGRDTDARGNPGPFIEGEEQEQAEDGRRVMERPPPCSEVFMCLVRRRARRVAGQACFSSTRIYAKFK